MDLFTEFLEEQLEIYRRQEQELVANECKDDANFIKIKVNVCGICKTLYQVACKKEEDALIRSEYMRLLNKLVTEWKASYEKAKEYGDMKKIVAEEMKLEVIEEIKERF